MKAIQVHQFGGPEVLEMRDLPRPEPRGPDQVLVRLKAASLNPADAYFRRYGPYIAAPGPLIVRAPPGPRSPCPPRR